MIGIYKITNPLGQVYIGQSKNIQRRFRQYKRINSSIEYRKLNESFVKYGVENHLFEIIKVCEQKDLNLYERLYQEKYKVIHFGLNCALVKTQEKKGIMSDSVKENMSKMRIGKKHKKETLFKMSMNNKKRKIVLNTETGIYYDSCLYASIAYSINYSTIRAMLNGSNPNKTNLIYV